MNATSGPVAVNGKDASTEAGQIAELRSVCRHVRAACINTIAHARDGHPGGSLSAVEFLVALYFHTLKIDPVRPDWPERDRFILSKGHAASAYYAVLARRGYFSEDKLAEFDAVDSMLQGHPCMLKTPGVDMSAGSLGQGLSVGAGMVLGRERTPARFEVYVMLGDGELQEGQIWEAAMFAGYHKLTGLIAIVDYNKVQLTGTVSDTLDVEPLKDKWESFGWHVLECDGHDIVDVIDTLKRAKEVGTVGPVVILAHTTKGKGVSFMEGKYQWHGGAPNEEERLRALADIEQSAT